MESTMDILILCSAAWNFPGQRVNRKCLVISSGGTGIPFFRSLQKKNIPFAAGILYTNDIDYQLAKLLAVHDSYRKTF